LRTKILKLEDHDEEREIEFEIEFLKNLTVQERFKMLEERRKFFQKQLSKYEHRKSFEIIKRV
jgi:hypothetical protein